MSTATTSIANADPYAQFGGRVATADPYAEFGGAIAKDQQPPAMASTPEARKAQAHEMTPLVKQNLDASVAANEKQQEDSGNVVKDPGPLNAVGRVVGGFLKAPGQILHAAFDKPANPGESIAAAQGGPAGLLGARMIGEPALETARKIVPAWKAGDPKAAAAYTLATALPMVGPWAANVGERIGKGDVSGGLTEAALGIGGPTAASEALRGASALPGVAADAVVTPSEERLATTPVSHNPAENFSTRGDTLDFAHSKGIYPTAAQAAGSKLAGTIQAIGERSLTRAGETLQDLNEANKGALQKEVSNFEDQVDPQRLGTTPQAVGDHLEKSADIAMNVAKENAQYIYEKELRPYVAGIDVPTGTLRATYGRELSKMSQVFEDFPGYTSEEKGLLASLGDAGKKGAQAGASRLTFDEAMRERSLLLDIARGKTGILNNRVQGIAASAASALDDAMQGSLDRAVKAGEISSAGAAKWRDANEAWRKLNEDFNDPQGPMYKVLKGQGGQVSASKILAKGTFGGDPAAIDKLKEYNFDLGPVKRAVIDDAAAHGFKLTARGGVGGYSHEYLNNLFTPEELHDLYQYGRVGRALKYETNPSGTSNVLLGEGQLRAIPQAATELATGRPLSAAGAVLKGVTPENIAARATIRSAGHPDFTAAPSFISKALRLDPRIANALVRRQQPEQQ